MDRRSQNRSKQKFSKLAAGPSETTQQKTEENPVIATPIKIPQTNILAIVFWWCVAVLIIGALIFGLTDSANGQVRSNKTITLQQSKVDSLAQLFIGEINRLEGEKKKVEDAISATRGALQALSMLNGLQDSAKTNNRK